MVVLIFPAAKLFVLILTELIEAAIIIFVLKRFVLIFAVVTPPVGENPPDKFNEVNVAVPELTLFVEIFPALLIFTEVILLVVIDEVKIVANESTPPSLIIVYQLLPFARNPIAP